MPVSLTDAAYKNFNANNTLPRLWLSPDKMEDSLDTEVEPESWILANIQGGGFYRVNYDERNWRLLSQQLHANHEAIHVLNRAHLISDAFAVAGVGLMSFGTVFDMLKYAKKEDHNVPWVTMRDGMAYIKDMVTSSRIERGFKVLITEFLLLIVTQPQLSIPYSPLCIHSHSQPWLGLEFMRSLMKIALSLKRERCY